MFYLYTRLCSDAVKENASSARNEIPRCAVMASSSWQAGNSGKDDSTGWREIESSSINVRYSSSKFNIHLILLKTFFRTLLRQLLETFSPLLLRNSMQRQIRKRENSHAFNNYCTWTWRLIAWAEEALEPARTNRAAQPFQSNQISTHHGRKLWPSPQRENVLSW